VAGAAALAGLIAFVALRRRRRVGT
jgi:uncharacterized protein (TIGR03382 family)